MTSTAVVLASSPVTDWPARIALTVGVLATLGVVLALMRLGWAQRGRRQSDISPLPLVPDLPNPVDSSERQPAPGAVDVRAKYIGATRAGDWLDRIVVHGLGVPSAATVTVTSHGIWIVRAGAPDVFVAVSELVGVRHDRAIAGRVHETEGVLVITWRHGDQLIDLGLRVRDVVAAEALRVAIAAVQPAPFSQSQPPLSSTTGDLA